ncbi:MAG TPA: hypothetical protein VIK72_16395 [Clostridiaceae bacterium]
MFYLINRRNEFGGFYGAIVGVTLGVAQWLLLRKYLNKVGYWILLTSIGWVLFNELNILNLFGEAKGIAIIPDLIHGTVFGVILGVLQWLLLRKRLQKSSWWIIASIAASTLGVTVGDGFNIITSSDAPGDVVISSILLGIITGVCMMRLLIRNQSNSKNTIKS